MLKYLSFFVGAGENGNGKAKGELEQMLLKAQQIKAAKEDLN